MIKNGSTTVIGNVQGVKRAAEQKQECMGYIRKGWNIRIR